MHLEELPKQTVVHQTRFPVGAKMCISALITKDEMYDIGNQNFPQSDYRIGKNITKLP